MMATAVDETSPKVTQEVFKEDSYDNTSQLNCTVIHDTDPSETQIIAAVLELILMLLICFGNGMVIGAFVRSRKLRTVTNYFIVNLSIADVCVGLLMPFHSTLFIRPVLLTDLYVCVFRYSSLMTVLGVSVLCLLAMSHDRYSAITKPLLYRSDMSRTKTVLTVGVVWLLPIIGLFIVPFTWNNSEEFYSSCECDFSTVLPSEYIQFIILPAFSICTVIVVFLYVRIFHVARLHLQNIRQMEAQLHAQRKYQKSLKLTKTAAIILGVFLLSWLPFMLIVATKEYFNVDTASVKTARTWSTLLAVLNSAWNPIIYAFRLPGFKAEFKAMLHIQCPNEDLSSSGRYDKHRMRCFHSQEERVVNNNES